MEEKYVMLQAQDKKRPGSFLAVDYKFMLYYTSSCGGPRYPTVGKVTGVYLSLQLGANFNMQPIFFLSIQIYLKIYVASAKESNGNCTFRVGGKTEVLSFTCSWRSFKVFEIVSAYMYSLAPQSYLQ